MHNINAEAPSVIYDLLFLRLRSILPVFYLLLGRARGLLAPVSLSWGG
jgi:hypothetical protein